MEPFIKVKTSRWQSVAVVGAIAALLVGCSTPNPSTTAEPSEKGIPQTSTPTATAPSTAPVLFSWQNIESRCTTYISAQELFDFNPNISLDPQLQIPLEAIPSALGALTGAKCVYVNQSSRAQTYLVVAKITDAQRPQLDQVVLSLGSLVKIGSTTTTAVWVQGISGGTLVIQKGNYLVVTSSVTFLSAPDAYEFIAPVLDRLN